MLDMLAEILKWLGLKIYNLVKKRSYNFLWNEFYQAERDRVNYIVIGTEKRPNEKVDSQTTIHQAYALAYLWNFLENISSLSKKLSTGFETLKISETDCVVLIGGPKNNQKIKKLIKEIEKFYELKIYIGDNANDFGNILQIKSNDGKNEFFSQTPLYDGEEDPRDVKEDIGIIIKVKLHGTTYLFFTGCHSIGTYGAAKAAINFKELRKIKKKKRIKINKIYDDLKIYVVTCHHNNETREVSTGVLVYP